MHPPLHRLGILCAACSLFACAALDRSAPHPSLPLMAISADEAYLIGRQHQLARASTDAARLYRQALASEPQHVNARNGLATVLAEQGDFTAAIALWQGLTAPLPRDPGPGAAYLFSNLGYAYYLAGQYALAQQAQERSCLLDPASALAWQRLADTLEKRGDSVGAARLQRQAQALLAHDPHVDAALAGMGASSVLTPAMAPAPADGWSQVELVAGLDGLLTLSRTRAREVAFTSAAAAPVAHGATLEITNGNGVTGMARATAQRVHAMGLGTMLRSVRISNEAGYGVRRTRIEYQPAFREMAERLAQQVQPGAPLIAVQKVQTAQTSAQADLRLVLGRDAHLAGTSVAAQQEVAQISAQPARVRSGKLPFLN